MQAAHHLKQKHARWPKGYVFTTPGLVVHNGSIEVCNEKFSTSIKMQIFVEIYKNLVHCLIVFNKVVTCFCHRNLANKTLKFEPKYSKKQNSAFSFQKLSLAFLRHRPFENP